ATQASGPAHNHLLDKQRGRTIVVVTMTTIKTTDASVQQLQALGFTEYEARAYVTLLTHGELSGYAWARESGIPRPNIYAVAEKLAERGAVQRGEGNTGKTWSPVPAEQLLKGLQVQ